MSRKKPTQMQSAFKELMVRPIMCILFPEFAEIIDEFHVSFRTQYTWVNLTAIRPAVYYGIDDRTKKERKEHYRPDPRELIEEKYSLEVGINNHWQTSNKLWGKITRKDLERDFDCIGFRAWRFAYSYGAGNEFTPEQIAEVCAYLKTQGIDLPSQDEFWEHYWSD